MFTAALFIIAPKWKLKCPSTDEWANKMWYIHIMEYYSLIKSNEVLTHATTWMNLENLMLSFKKKPITKGCILWDSIYMKCPA